MQHSPFAYSDYKEFLRKCLEEGAWGEVSRWAKSAGCQRSYLSRVLHEHVQLTPDQAYGLAQGLGLVGDEREYFLLLVDHARAGSKALVGHLEGRLAELRRRQEDLSQRLKREVRGDPGGAELAYYSSWLPMAAHLLTSIPEFQSETNLAARLGVRRERVQAMLQELEVLGLVRREGALWKYVSGSIHIPKNSPLVSLHHNNWRQRAVLNAQDPGQDSVHYTMAQSMSRQAYDEIKHKLLLLIEESAAIGQAAKEEELVVVCCDLFRA